MSFEQSKWVWMNGELLPWASATIHVSAHALHYGSGVFEGLRCYQTREGPAVFRLDAHLERLYRSAEVYGIEIPYTVVELADAICSVVRQNEFTGCYIRPICFYGSNGLSLDPRNCPVEVAVFAWPWAPYLGSAGLENGVRVTVSPWRKFQSEMMPTTAKACGQYLNSILAVRDAVERGYDEALMLGADGTIAEGPGENLFIVQEEKLVTNDKRDSILMGITRDAVIEIARNLGYLLETRAIELDELLSAEEVFFTGTAAEVTPIREIDGTVIGDGKPGPITKKVQKSFFAATDGHDPQYKHWLHLVNTPALAGI